MLFKSPSLWNVSFLLLSFVVLGERAPAQDEAPRRSALVAAVEKTRPSTVTIKTPNPQGGKDMIGAGIIIDARGYIVTNRHVTAGKKYVKVRLHDGTELNGEIITADLDFDLAVIRIKTEKKLAAARINPAADLMVGESVFAVGNPLGYEGTVSRGIISALNREVKMPNDIVMKGLIQHDVPINPGSSGGPLVNLNAEVIGINVAMRDNAQNIAFAINAETIDSVLSRLLSANRVAGIAHGLTCASKECECSQRKMVVTAVAKQSPASAAGVRTGDIVLHVGDIAVANRLDLERVFWDKEAGARVPITILREKEEHTFYLRIEQLDKAM